MHFFQVSARSRSDRGAISIRLIALSAASLVVVAALVLTYLSSSEPPPQQPKVTRVLDKLDRDNKERKPRVSRILDRLAAGRDVRAADKGDSPTKGPAPPPQRWSSPRTSTAPSGR